MRLAKPLTLAGIVALIIAAACDGGAKHLPSGPAFDITSTDPHIKELTVCKYGSASTFSKVVNGVPEPDFSLADGECAVEDTHTEFTPAHNITLTEHVPAGYQLDSIVNISTFNGTKDVILGTNVITVRVGNDQGRIVKFYNSALPPIGEIGDFVWNDVNGNGIQDAGEPGIQGVVVTLTGPVGATATTDVNGAYLFTGLPAGSYTVTVGTPGGYTATLSNQGSDPEKDSNGSPAGVTLAGYGSIDNSIDFGFVPIPPPPSGQIGDFVWNDLNGNGIQDAGEPGIAGVTVTLSGAASATTTSNGAGAYLFTGLAAGNYTVTVTTPAGYTSSPTGAGTPATDNNGSPALVTLPTSSSTDYTIDFGFKPPPVCTPVSNPSNFNGTPIAAGNTIWFNTIFKPKGVPASGGTVNFTGSSIAITSGANHFTVSVPNARITFSPSASSASTTFDNATNTWLTVVPVGYTGNIFLSGVGYVPPGGLPGGANPVTWTGQVTTNMPGFSMNWQWAAAVYTSFGPLSTVGAKPIDGNTLNPYANSDHAGTPESFKSSVVGGARGGGGSNWTGSYSGTVAPPVCVY